MMKYRIEMIYYTTTKTGEDDYSFDNRTLLETDTLPTKEELIEKYSKEASIDDNVNSYIVVIDNELEVSIDSFLVH